MQGGSVSLILCLMWMITTNVDAVSEQYVQHTNNHTRNASVCHQTNMSGTCTQKLQRFYFNASIGKCLAFIYNGCGGNNNRFDTLQQCQQLCSKDSDTSLCIGTFAESSARIDCSNDLCPHGFICKTNKRSISGCCNEADENNSLQSHSSYCPGGSRALRSVNDVLLATSCDQLMCPDGYECLQASASSLAKCCHLPLSNHFSPSLAHNLNTAEKQKAESIIEPHNPFSPSIISVCDLQKDEGNCTHYPHAHRQYFYYNAEWQSCMTFIYTGCGGNANKFLTREQCEAHCQYADGSACLGPVPSIIPEDNDGDCTNTTCPEGYQCAYGFGFIECCNSTIKNAVSEAYASKCPDGSQAGGVSKDYFMATFAASCDDLMCNSDQRCVQVSQFFAKCCSDNTTILSPSETMVESGRRMHTLPCKQYSSPTTP